MVKKSDWNYKIMSINKICFEDGMDIIIDILNKYDISDKQSRLAKITKIYNKMMKEEKIDREFYSLAHEIKSYDFIKTFGEARLTNDNKHEKGPDIVYGKNKIECVACSEGKITEFGYKDYSINYCKKTSTVINYNKTKEFLLPRITNSLGEKGKKVEKYIKENIIKQSECAIIFISLGELNIDFYSGTYGEEFLEVLIGKGPLCYVFDRESKKIINCYWKYNKYIKKNKGKEFANINSVYFNDDNIDIAGVILSTASIYEKYNFDNTFLFLNPHAKNPIDTKDFKDMIYWACNQNNEYIPMKNRKKMKQ